MVGGNLTTLFTFGMWPQEKKSIRLVGTRTRSHALLSPQTPAPSFPVVVTRPCKSGKPARERKPGVSETTDRRLRQSVFRRTAGRWHRAMPAEASGFGAQTPW